MLMAFFPLSLPFFLFFFLKIHFLQTQKQQANTKMMATKAIETMAHDGTAGRKQAKRARVRCLAGIKHLLAKVADEGKFLKSADYTHKEVR